MEPLTEEERKVIETALHLYINTEWVKKDRSLSRTAHLLEAAVGYRLYIRPF